MAGIVRKKVRLYADDDDNDDNDGDYDDGDDSMVMTMVATTTSPHRRNDDDGYDDVMMTMKKDCFSLQKCRYFAVRSKKIELDRPIIDFVHSLLSQSDILRPFELAGKCLYFNFLLGASFILKMRKFSKSFSSFSGIDGNLNGRY